MAPLNMRKWNNVGCTRPVVIYGQEMLPYLDYGMEDYRQHCQDCLDICPVQEAEKMSSF